MPPTPRVGVAVGIAEHHRRQVFEIDLVDDAGIGRNHAEVLKGGLRPAQEAVALAVARIFQQRIGAERVRRAKLVHLYGMIDDQVRGQLRIGLARIDIQHGERIAHGGQIDGAGDAGEILQQDARRHEADLFHSGFSGGNSLDVGSGDALAVFVPQQVFEQNFDGDREPRHLGEPAFFQGVEAEDPVESPHFSRASRRKTL